MNIEIGKYIRTNWGIIGKVLDITSEDTPDGIKQAVVIDNLAPVVFVSEISKCSENILDLIEIGDVLSLYDNEYDLKYKSEVFDAYEEKICVSNFGCSEILKLEEALNSKKIRIIAVVTKECFKSVEYEVNK